ncbi:PadR family transcriptional regulator [Staphylococcus capitis]|uniref:PadR family transcriptional regulator n=1 Tax=Staphylococcus capitis TaxID=29388 RepID=A0A7Z7YTL5_STACP|nr:PadR family transcriptional regulator [Staphylococcus capitis]
MKKGVLEFLVLLCLSKETQYGYSLLQRLNKRIPISERTLYSILHRLEKKSCLMINYRLSSKGPKRKYYKVTVTGEKDLMI